MSYRLFKILCVLVVFYSFNISNVNSNKQAFAQSGATTGSVSGSVKDSQGKVIFGTTLYIKQIETNLERTLQLPNTGIYSFNQLLPGIYEIRAEADGFSPQTQKLTVNIGRTILVNFNLSVGETNVFIEVDANNLIDVNKTESSTNITRQSIDTLPINQRNFLDFSLTSARVTRDRIPPNGTTATSGLSFNGQTARANNLTVDGSSNNDSFTGGVLSTFSQEAVQEFQIVSDSFTAEFGRSAGGVINIVTKSGTNSFQGSLFNFIRSDSISARDVFTAFKPEFKQYQFGATLSGPIKRDKAFFFTSFERLSVKQNNIVTISNQIIESIQRQGFSDVTNGALPFAIGTTTLLARSDINISSNDKLAIRYNGGFTYDGAFETILTTLGGLISPTSSGIRQLEDNTINISNIYANTNFINETRFLYANRDQRVLSANIENPLVQIITNEGQIIFGRNFLTPQIKNLQTYQFVNNFSFVRNKQQIKVGVDYNYNNAPNMKSDFTIIGGGFAAFVPLDFSTILGIKGLPSFSSLEAFDPNLRTIEQRNFLSILSQLLPSQIPGFPSNVPLENLSLPGLFGQSFGFNRQSVNQKLFSTFIQDDIRLTPNLLLKLGLRYDIFRQTFTPSNNGNFSPRIAFSFQPKEKLTFRGAYGIFFASSPSLVPAIIVGGYNSQRQTFEPNSAILQYFLFPFSVLPFSLPQRRFPEIGQLPPGVSITPQLTQSYQYQPDLRNSYTQQITTGVSYNLTNTSLISAEYNFVRGNKLFSSREINPIVRPIASNPILSALIGRNDLTKGRVLNFESAFDSYYNGLTLTFNHRATNQFNFLASYTYSKSIDNYVDFRTDIAAANNSLRIDLERGLSLQDVRHRLVVSGTWNIDYKKSLFLKDFQLSTIMNVESGRPYNLLAGTDVNMDGDIPVADRPLDIGRNTGITPGFFSVDMRLSRIFFIKDKYKIQTIVEAFNLFNKVNISQVNDIFPPDSQGNFNLPPQENGRFTVPSERFTNAFSPRQLQIGVKLIF